jgi:hypothetical protein
VSGVAVTDGASVTSAAVASASIFASSGTIGARVGARHHASQRGGGAKAGVVLPEERVQSAAAHSAAAGGGTRRSSRLSSRRSGSEAGRRGSDRRGSGGVAAAAASEAALAGETRPGGGAGGGGGGGGASAAAGALSAVSTSGASAPVATSAATPTAVAVVGRTLPPMQNVTRAYTFRPPRGVSTHVHAAFFALRHAAACGGWPVGERAALLGSSLSAATLHPVLYHQVASQCTAECVATAFQWWVAGDVHVRRRCGFQVQQAVRHHCGERVLGTLHVGSCYRLDVGVSPRHTQLL